MRRPGGTVRDQLAQALSASMPASGLEDSVFMKPSHLHLTLVMFKLYSDARRHQAAQVR